MTLNQFKKALFGAILFLSFYNCDDIIDLVDLTGNNVELLAPTQDAALTTPIPTFTWVSVEGAENYHIQIATPNFEQALQIVSDSITVSTNFTKALSIGEYQWRVRALNTNYTTPYTTQSFTIE